MDPVVLCNNCQHEFIPDAEIKHIPIIAEEMVRTNQLPTPADLQQVPLYLEQENRALERCDQEIGRLEKAMEQLRARRAVLVRRIERRNSWISPIRRLPNEILYKIFAMVCRGKHGYGLDIVAQGTLFAPTLYLTHVSCHWRQVVNASARLWCSMRICGHSSALALLRHYLTMSKECPLNIEFIWTTVKGVFNILMPHLSRIERLSFHWNHTVFDGISVSELPSFASLRFLNWNHTTMDSLPAWFTDAFRTAPNLTDLTIYYAPDANELPYHQLTRLEVWGYRDWRSLITTLRLCRRLQHLKVELLAGSENDLHDSQVELPMLRHLSVSSNARHGSGIDVFTLPSLITIYARDILSLEPFTRLIHRSGCSLVKFRFAHSPAHHSSSTEIHEFLSKCPRLTELKFCYIHEDRGAEETLAGRLFGAYDRPEITGIPGGFAQGESPTSSDSAPLSSRGSITPNLTLIRVFDIWPTATSQDLLGLLSKIESWNKLRIRHAAAGVLKPKNVLVTVNQGMSALCWPTQKTEDINGIRARIRALKKDGIRCEFKITRSSQ
ncbi:hypothetical protein VNI00_004581 [Paramarasmius palmivorus]|uniref:F-box domain-containing protein n=1 Tax=Paramarasmius palmivorus TaxID=297713 RepID=A0AAW0DLP9_9AGAR